MRNLFFSLAVLISATLSLAAQDVALSKILVEKEGWREIRRGLPDISYMESEPPIHVSLFHRGELSARLSVDGEIEKIMLPSANRITRNERVAITHAGTVYSIAWGGGWVDHIPSAGKHDMLKLPGLTSPGCLTLWPDEGHLVIGDGAYLWAVRIEKYGSFGPGDRYYSLRTRPNEKMHVTAMTMDAGYLLYACTPLGIQVFDPMGRLSGVIAAPAKETMTAITIGGVTADDLFVAAGSSIYARKIQGKAIYTLKKAK